MRKAVDLFGGPGGWEVYVADLGLVTVGIERDASACRTRAAAGLLTIRADVARYDPARFAGFDGVIGSPPCPTFSSAGKGAGTRVLHVLDVLLRETFAGLHTIARRTREMARLLRAERLATTKVTKVEASEWAWRQARMSALVVQPLRWALIIRPRWIALEQVPAVLPLWRTYAELLREAGYSVWCGVLNAADYGVPQTRKRAILTASLDRAVTVPEPTHAQKPTLSLFGEPLPWVSMADALGWGMTERPMPTVTGGGVANGGPEPIARGGRALLEKERGGASWLSPTGEHEVTA